MTNEWQFFSLQSFHGTYHYLSCKHHQEVHLSDGFWGVDYSSKCQSNKRVVLYFIEPSPRAEWWCNGENPASVGILKGCQLAVIHQILTISIGAALCLSTIFCRSRMASSPTPGLCLLLQLGTNDWKHEHVIKNTAWWLSSVICSCHSPWDYHGVLNTFLQGWRPWKGQAYEGYVKKKKRCSGHGDMVTGGESPFHGE